MNRRTAWWALAALGVSGAAVAVTGCGDDTASPAGPDGSIADSTAPDSGTDSAAPPDATGDQTTADVANDQTTAEAGGDAGEAGSDAGDAGDAGAEAAIDAGCGPFDAGSRDDASVQAGMLAVWQVYKCQGCHQKASQKVDDAGAGLVLSGNNDGLGDSGLVFPPNLTSDPATGLGCWTDSQVLNAILHGKKQDGTDNLCPSMPKWGNALKDLDGGPGPRLGTPMDAVTGQQIVDFLRTLPVVSNMVTETMCPMPEGGATDASDAASADAGDAGAEAGPAPDAGGDAADGATE